MPRKKTTEEFILDAKLVHGDMYDYSKAVYGGSQIKVEIICPTHGSFKQTPLCHVSLKQNCPTCGKEIGIKNKTFTQEKVIKMFEEVWGNTYDYSQVEYKKFSKPVKIICKIHGVFNKAPSEHYHQKSGCTKCSRDKLGEQQRLNQDDVVDRLKRVHGDKYLYHKVVYVGATTPVEVVCPKEGHGSFFPIPSNHLYGKSGCPKCANDLISQSRIFSQEQVIDSFIRIYGNRYDYSLVNYKGDKIKIKIICSKHGVFEKTPFNHKQWQGCPLCKCSRGELRIHSFLEKHKFFFERQSKIENCKSKKPLPFDFAIFEDQEKTKIKMLIEFDGEHYFKPILRSRKITLEKAEERFRKTKIHDGIKNQYCLDHGIPLLRIPYWDFEKVEEILEEALGF